VSVNRLCLERYHYLQSTFLKTKDVSAFSASENYRHMLIEIAGQLRKSDTEFRNAAARLLELLAAEAGKAQPMAFRAKLMKPGAGHFAPEATGLSSSS
jgi:hypothetical protein